MPSGAAIVSIIIGLVSDGRFRIDMDERVIHRGIGEGIDTLLIDQQPIGRPGLLTDAPHQLLSSHDLHRDSSRSIPQG